MPVDLYSEEVLKTLTKESLIFIIHTLMEEIDNVPEVELLDNSRDDEPPANPANTPTQNWQK